MKTRLLFLSCLVALAAPAVAQATILSFQDATSAGGAVPSAYGDNVTALPTDGDGFHYGNDGSPTPNVALDYSNVGWYQGGSVPPVTFPLSDQSTGTSWAYTFTAAPGFVVDLQSFQFGTNSGNAPVIDYTVTGGASPVSGSFTDSDALTSLGTLNLGGIVGQNLVLTMTVGSPAPTGDSGLGITNITFTQASVPEPSSCVLMGVGVLAALFVVGRRRR